MELGNEFRARIEEWDGLSRWERSELGKDVRRVGLSYGEIMDLIPVKKSTLATWFRDVRLTQEQWAAIKSRRPPISGIPRDTTQRKRHRETDLIGLKHDSKPFTFRTTPSGQWAFPSTGPKGQVFERLELAHSEPEALRLFISWARIFLRSDAIFGAAINLHFDNDEQAAKSFWSAELGIDSARFTKTFIKPDGTGHRKNHLRSGVCRVTMKRSTDAFITTMAWVDFVRASFRN
ncbi:MAG TPA: hypothetical protein VE027_07275 [Acidimicrobiia bacterium]|nr:hypothetical protein [Acidimicrobiia bacterium]